MAMHDLTADRLRELLAYEPETGKFVWRVTRRGRAIAGSTAGTLHSNGYWEIQVDGRPYRAHRLAWLYVHGKMPAGVLDHINRDKLDNRIANLRDSTTYLNMRNTGIYAHNSSGSKGVHWKAADKRWHASIVDQGTRFHLGAFLTREEAAAAREGAERVLFALQ